jgi:predicted DCC family thiol-disulfide oxidoreductase YuxK
VQTSDLAGHTLVLYDGVCGLCNGIVRFMLRFDSHDCFRYAALQSEFAREILKRHDLNPADLDSVVLVTDFGNSNEKAHAKFDAVLAGGHDLGGIWRLAALTRVFPRRLRTWFYDTVARNRYKWFGRYDTCPIPKPEHRVKFVDHTK